MSKRTTVGQEEYIAQQKEQFREIKSKAVDAARFNKDELKSLQDRLYRMITYTVGRHDWYATERDRFLQIGIGLLAASAGIGAVFAQLAEHLTLITNVLVLSTIVSLFATGIGLLYIYNQGVERDHPYRKVADIKSWYFKYNLPSGLEDEISDDPKLARIQVGEIVDNIDNFVQRWTSLVKEKHGFIKEDLEQVFILQLLQRYRAQQLKRMSRSLFYGLILTFSFLTMSIAMHMYHVLSTEHNENITSAVEAFRGYLSHADKGNNTKTRSLYVNKCWFCQPRSKREIFNSESGFAADKKKQKL